MKKLGTFREWLREEEASQIDEQVFTKKDIGNKTLNTKTAELGIRLLNNMENDVNTYMRWLVFNDNKDIDDVKNYERIFNEFIEDFKKFSKLMVTDYKSI